MSRPRNQEQTRHADSPTKWPKSGREPCFRSELQRGFCDLLSVCFRWFLSCILELHFALESRIIAGLHEVGACIFGPLLSFFLFSLLLPFGDRFRQTGSTTMLRARSEGSMPRRSLGEGGPVQTGCFRPSAFALRASADKPGYAWRRQPSDGCRERRPASFSAPAQDFVRAKWAATPKRWSRDFWL
jgi:hypothetical protein